MNIYFIRNFTSWSKFHLWALFSCTCSYYFS